MQGRFLCRGWGFGSIVKQVGLDGYLLSMDGGYWKAQQTQQYDETHGHTFHINIEYRWINRSIKRIFFSNRCISKSPLWIGVATADTSSKRFFFDFDFDDKTIILNQKNVVKNRFNSNSFISKNWISKAFMAVKLAKTNSLLTTLFLGGSWFYRSWFYKFRKRISSKNVITQVLLGKLNNCR